MFKSLLPEIVCQRLREAGLRLAPAQVRLERREACWVAYLPDERIAWFAASAAGLDRLKIERRVLNLLEARCTFQAPRLLYEAEDHSFDLRAKVVGLHDPAGVHQRLRQDADLASLLGEGIGRILVEQHSCIRANDMEGWLPQQVAWPKPGDWIRERVPQVVTDPRLIANIDELLAHYEMLAIGDEERALVHTDVALHNLALDPTTLAVRGIFDFEGAAWADRCHDFRYLVNFSRPELLAAALAIYEPAVGRSLSHYRILLYNAVCAFSYLAYRLGTLPNEASGGRTLAEDIDWSRRAIRAVRQAANSSEPRLARDLAKHKQVETALQETTAKLMALREVGLELVAQLELPSLLQSIALHARKLLGCDRGGFHLYRSDQQALELVVKIDPTNPLHLGNLIKPGEGVVGKVWQAGQPLVVNRYREWTEKFIPMANVSATDPAQVPGSVAGVPVQWGNENLGVLIVAAEAKDYFTEAHLELLTLFAAQAAVAIHNARLHEQVQQHATRLEQEVAERKRAEAELKEYSERLEEMVQARTQSLEEAQERLLRQEKLAVLGQLAGSVGHELRNPLGVIGNAIYFLQMVLGETNETVKEYLELIASRVVEADTIVAGLLNLARTRQAARQLVTVSTLLEDALRRYPPPPGISLHQALTPDLPPLLIDPQQLGQVLANLLTNAYQAMPEGGQLTLSAQADAAEVKLSVSDTGIGMEPETMGKIFEPLFTTKAKGIGLGLVVSRNLVEVNGGVITVESAPGQGSTFTIILPTQ